MSERPIADVGPLACPFVAFEHDQARRSIEPDRRHRCYAEPAPAPRAISHQTTYCLSPGFSACPTFRAWAKRTAARQSDDRSEPASRPVREVPVAPMPQMADPAAMGLVTDDSRPAVGAAGAGRVAAEQMRAEASAPGWTAPPTWSGSMIGTDDELASLVRPPAGGGPEADLDAGDMPAFLAGRPSVTSATSETRASTSGPDSADGAGAGGTSARPRSSVGQARPASRGLRRPARIDAAAPAWETPRRFEAYPTLRTRVGMPRVPTIALGVVAVLAAALLLFLLPSIVAGPTATPTPTPQSSVASEAPVTPEPVATPLTYTIVANDTISKIAKKFNVTPEDLLAANPQVKNPNRIQVGDQLTIPVSVSAEPSQDAVPSDEVSPSP
ncbi:MAG TPA: LysM peptidoglycan-binding domain-containing protein [Candidatus Limnocylindrales bacterium]